LARTIDLMLTYVENGTQFTREFGDINEAYYNSLESVLHEMRSCYGRKIRRCIRSSGNGFSGWTLTSATSVGGIAIIFRTKSICSKRSRPANESGLH
jgi:hypothetical protein